MADSSERPIRAVLFDFGGVIAEEGFYQGLKAFAGDPDSRMMIDNMIAEEGRHVRLLTRSLDRVRVAPDRSVQRAPASLSQAQKVSS